MVHLVERPLKFSVHMSNWYNQSQYNKQLNVYCALSG